MIANSKNGSAIDHGARGRTVTVDAVGPGAEHVNVLSCYLFSTGEGELLIASADATISNGHGNLATRDQTDARYIAAQFPQTVKQVVGGFVIGPVIAGVMDFNGKTSVGGGYGGFIDSDLIREHGPPARADERGVVRFWRLVEGMLAEEIGDGCGKLIDEVVFGGDGLAVLDGSGIGHSGAGGERVGGGVGHIGDKNRNLLGRIGGLRQASALDGGEMFANGIDLSDGSAGVHQRLVGGGEISERNVVVLQGVFHSNDGPFDDRRASPRDHKDDEGSGVESREGFENGIGGADRFGGGGRGAARERAK